MGSVWLIFLVFFVLSSYVSLPSEFHVICVCTVVSTNIVLCFCFVFLRLVCPSMLPIFWIILFWLALRYYLTFIPLWYLHYFQWISTCTYVTDTLKTLVRDSCWKSKIDFCSQDHENNDQKNRQLRHPIKENKINSYQCSFYKIFVKFRNSKTMYLKLF